MDDVQFVNSNIKKGLYFKSGNTVTVCGQGGDGEYFMEKRKGGSLVDQEEFYDVESFIAAMKELAPLPDWQIGKPE
jgi:hypothetical protein